jgi:hypothetical protein
MGTGIHQHFHYGRVAFPRRAYERREAPLILTVRIRANL